MNMSAASQYGAHQKTGSGGSISYPPAPASPTLTNPDMILPDSDYGADSPDEPQSPVMMWDNANNANMQQFNLGGQAFAMGPITPTTPIIYGNGTMLSDIGEVTEVESTYSPTRVQNASRDSAISYHITPAAEAMPAFDGVRKQRQQEQRFVARDRQRRLSMESTSTITMGDQGNTLGDFDDTVSVGDSAFQGDDEESIAASSIYDDASVADERVQSNDRRSSGISPEDEERYSSALSRRAEKILATAKKRLTTMEGNLTRARSSLSYGSGSTPSPPVTRPATTIHREHDADLKGHSRIFSENNVPNGAAFRSLTSARSASALGAAGGYRQPLQTSRSADHIRGNQQDASPNGSISNHSSVRSKSSRRDSRYTLEPLSEDEGLEQHNSSRNSSDDAKMDRFLSPTPHYAYDHEIRRSASSADMRDLKDHMKDLKDRLSVLRDQARADSMKRHSLQSLRTPSPFTHARIAQWYADPHVVHNDEGQGPREVENVENGVVLHLDSRIDEVIQDQAQPEADRISLSSSRYSNEDDARPQVQTPPESPKSIGEDTPTQPARSQEEPGEQYNEHDQDDMTTEDGYEDYEEAAHGDDASESGESYYEEAVPYQVSHEDRADAFDYEHFFLHSAMGSMTQQRLRRQSSAASISSESSVETTRGPTVLIPSRVGRRGSMDSISTTDSFATATEGRLTRAQSMLMDEISPELSAPVSERSGSRSPRSARRATFGFENANGDRPQSHSPASGKRATFGFDNPNTDFSLDRRISMSQRPKSSAASYMHRPSIASVASVGTNRSFPLVNRPKSKNGILTPTDSPEQGLKQISQTLMEETASICDRESIHHNEGDKAPMDALQRDEQILVERLVASLGKCVLGLTESGKASADNRMYRRRLDMAWKILEGTEETA